MRRWLTAAVLLVLIILASCERESVVPEAATRSTDAPDASPDADAEKPDGRPTDLVLAFGNEGDIWGAMADGRVVNLTKSRAGERNPTISYSGTRIVFERGRRLVELDLRDGTERVFATGSWPTFGPRGYLAWANDEGEIVVGSPEVGEIAKRPAAKVGGVAEHVAWDQNLESVYYGLVYGETSTPYAMDVIRVEGWACSSCGGGLELGRSQPIYPDGENRGDFLSTALGSDVAVVRVCCRTTESGGWQEAEIGGLEHFDFGVNYHRLRRLHDIDIDLSGQPLLLRDAGLLKAKVRGDVVRWRLGKDTVWVLSDLKHLWLVPWHGTPIRLPFEATGGVSVSPAFSESPFTRLP